MLYQLLDYQRATFRPLAKGAGSLRKVLSHRYSPARGPASRVLKANLELFERSWQDYDKPDWGLDRILTDGGLVPVEERVIIDTPFCELRRFKRGGEERPDDPSVLVVAPLAGHYATLIRDTVQSLLPNHKVYVTDWKNARDVPLEEGPFGLDDCTRTLISFLEHIGPGTHCLAVCQPCVPVLMAVAAMAMDENPARPASMMLMAGPVDARIQPTTTLALVRQQGLQWFEDNVVDKVPAAYPGRGRRVYSGFRQLSAFSSWKSTDHIHRHLQFYRDLVVGNKKRAAEHRAFYDNYMAVMDIPAEFYLDTLQRVFGDQKLAKGTATFEGRTLDLSAITDVPLMTIEGGKDDATPIGQTSAAHNLCTSLRPDQRKVHIQRDVGHYGVFSGSRFRSHIAPELGRFMRAHPPR